MVAIDYKTFEDDRTFDTFLALQKDGWIISSMWSPQNNCFELVAQKFAQSHVVSIAEHDDQEKWSSGAKQLIEKTAGGS